jgi:uncharacterized protein Usg
MSQVSKVWIIRDNEDNYFAFSERALAEAHIKQNGYTLQADGSIDNRYSLECMRVIINPLNIGVKEKTRVNYFEYDNRLYNLYQLPSLQGLLYVLESYDTAPQHFASLNKAYEYIRNQYGVTLSVLPSDKRCVRCGEIKALNKTNFGVYRGKFHSYCRSCYAAYHRLQYAKRKTS